MSHQVTYNLASFALPPSRLYNTRSAETAALHIVLGDRQPLDVARVDALVGGWVWGDRMRLTSARWWEDTTPGLLMRHVRLSQALALGAMLVIGQGYGPYIPVLCPSHPQDGSHRHFVCQAAYGFLGDVMRFSEGLRFLGPSR